MEIEEVTPEEIKEKEPVKDAYIPSAVDENGMLSFADASQVNRVAQELLKLGAVPKRFDTVSKLTGPLFFLAQTRRPYAFLRYLCEINGTMTVFAEGLPALCQNDPMYGEVEEYWLTKEGKRIGDENIAEKPFAAICKLRRKDSKIWNMYYFTCDDALGAGLMNNSKKETWMTYTRDHLMHKARARAYKAMYPSSLTGLDVYEDRIDYDEPRDVSDGLKTLRGIGEDKAVS